MKLIVVNSGSQFGNCYLVECEQKFLSLDAGCQWKKVQVACGFQVSNIDCCFLTHEHGDHVAHYKQFNKFGIPVYAEEKVAERIMEINGEHIRSLQERKINVVHGGYKVIPINVPHENTPNSAYMIEFPNGERLLYATDFEFIPVRVATWHINYFLIAVNHSEEIPEDAHAREHRLRGHSSLDVVKRFLTASMSSACKSVTACHLSSLYADPERIKRELQEVCGDNVAVHIAEVGKTFDL